MGQSPSRNARGTRLLAICALLLAVFAMHGGPAAAGGCHGAMPVTSAATTPVHAVMATSSAELPNGHGPVLVPATAGMGSLCVSTPVRSTALHLPSLVWAAALAAMGAVVRRRTRAQAGSRRRGPPGSGRDLLLQVCVART
ncbi:hypothetical protein [Streptacidiphilus carbonis]|jgi:hypothetical protein|uniref:hypothetical protein n=1 Tax=Streptacidiphilus carbonis TaxID=105422 RepID=UPI0005A79359|nr:hypothetical protein [Streptacidiphilus carbonis]